MRMLSRGRVLDRWPALDALERVGRWFVAGCALVCVLDLCGLQLVCTPSVPMGWYVRHELGERGLERGEYVCLEGWRASAPPLLRAAIAAGVVPREWGKNDRLTKRVAGIAGDRITYVEGRAGGHVEVNGVAIPSSTALERDGVGVRLPRPPYPVVVRRDEVWLSSEHPRGFDSRYFGPVKLEALGCRAELVWAW